MDVSERASRAIDVAHEAGTILLKYFRSDGLVASAKGDKDVVTRADLESEKMVRSRLHAAFPDDGLVAEEGSRDPSQNGLRWFVDPLDGTLNYSRGIAMWCVSLALFEGSEPILGVIHDPLRNETFVAVSGQGATCNGDALTCSGLAEPARAVVHMTIDFDERAQQSGLEDIARVAPHVLRTRNLGSAALSLAYTAAGWLDAMLHRSANPWDYGAGVVLVREAGGICTSIDGRPYSDAVKTLAAASSVELHRSLIALVSQNGNSPLQ